jgi:hypothetical protein
MYSIRWFTPRQVDMLYLFTFPISIGKASATKMLHIRQIKPLQAYFSTLAH